MATKKKILAEAKKLGVNLAGASPVTVTAFVTCVGVSSTFTSLATAIRKCAKKLGLL